MKKLSKKSLILILIAVITMIIISIVIISTESMKAKITNELTSIAETYKLTDVKIHIGNKMQELDLYEVIVECSNLEELSTNEMYSLSDSMKYIDNAYITRYKSNGNTYEIFSYNRSIYKNGEELHDDYFNSDSYESALKNQTSIDKNDTVVTDDYELSACWALAKDVVKNNLKSPSSAKFPFSYGSNDVIITKSDNAYTVKSWVEAENSYGANVRSNFTVTMERSGSGKDSKFTEKSCKIY